MKTKHPKIKFKTTIDRPMLAYVFELASSLRYLGAAHENVWTAAQRRAFNSSIFTAALALERAEKMVEQADKKIGLFI